MTRARAALEAWLKSHPEVPLDPGDLLYSYDKPRIHEAAMEHLEKLGITPYDRVPLPVYSPDMHQTIEQVHSILSKLLFCL